MSDEIGVLRAEWKSLEAQWNSSRSEWSDSVAQRFEREEWGLCPATVLPLFAVMEELKRDLEEAIRDTYYPL